MDKGAKRHLRGNEKRLNST